MIILRILTKSLRGDDGVWMNGWVWQHVCTWAIFSDDMGRKIETHHYPARLNEDFLQCAVYDSDQSNARLIGTLLLNGVISWLSFRSCCIACYPNFSWVSYKLNLGLLLVCLSYVRIHTDYLNGASDKLQEWNMSSLRNSLKHCLMRRSSCGIPTVTK